MPSRLLSLLVLLAMLPFLTGATIVIRGPRVPSGGTPAWWYSVPLADDDGSGVADSGTLLWVDTGTIGAGTASKLGLEFSNYSANRNVNIGLYNNAGTKLQEATLVATANGFIEVTITNQSVSAANYKIAWVPESGGGVNHTYKGSSSTTRYYKYGAYYGALPSSLPAADGSDAIGYVAGVYVTP